MFDLSCTGNGSALIANLAIVSLVTGQREGEDP